MLAIVVAQLGGPEVLVLVEQPDPVAGPGGEIYRYTLESDTLNLQQLSEIQRWTVIPALKSAGPATFAPEVAPLVSAASRAFTQTTG